MCRSSLLLLSCCSLLLGLTGCGRAKAVAAGPVEPSESSTAQREYGALGPHESLYTGWTLQVDASGAAAIRLLNERLTQAVNQGRYYDLDISKFLSSTTLRAASVRRDLTGDLIVQIEHRHPFRAPDFSAPMTAANRADLSYSGKLLVLADQIHVPFSDENLQTDPTILRDPDGYAATGSLLYRAGFTNNLFPYKLLVDEALNNRNEVSNGALPQGNYNNTEAGWNRANAGTSGDGWTGFDVLHAGQSVTVELAIPRKRLESGPIEVPLAILIKYVDPRGTPDFTGRFPADPPDAVAFSYRMPHGAFDAGRCQSCNDLQILNSPGSSVSFQVRIRDWDSLGADAPDETLWDNPAPDTILPGAGALPVVNVSAPGLMIGTGTLDRLTGSGLPGDEFVYEGEVTRDTTGVQPGTYYALVTVADLEFTSAGYDGLHYGVDPNSLLATTSRALPLATYHVFPIEVLPYQGWIRPSPVGASSGQAMDVGEDGTSVIAYYSHTGTVDVDPGRCVDLRAPNGNLDMILAWFDSFGNPGAVVQLAGTSADLASGIQLDSAGRVLVVGASQSADLDFDPGPGTTVAYDGTHRAAYLARYRADGTLDLVTFLGTGATTDEQSSGLDVTTDASDAIYVTGMFIGDVLDFDPTGASDLRSSATLTTFLSGYSPTGDYLWTQTWNESGSATPFALIPLADDRLAIGGQLGGTFDLDPGSGTQLHTAPGTASDAWFAVLDLLGQFQWASAFGGGQIDRVTGLGQQPLTEAIYASGSFSQTVDFDPGPGTESRASAGLADCFVSLFSPDGVWDQVITYGGNGNDLAWTGDMSATGRYLMGGEFTGNMDFDPGSGVDNADAGSAQDAFIWRLDSDLDYLGATVVGSPSFSFTTEVRWSPVGNRPTALFTLQPGDDVHPGPEILPYTGGSAALIQYNTNGSW